MTSRPRLIFLLNSAQRRLQQWLAAQQLEASGDALHTPSPAHSGVLFALDKADGATMGELALALDLAPSAVTGLIQRMEAMDWVRRKSCQNDARTQRVWLTPAGRKQLPSLYQALRHVNARLTEGFSEGELHTIARWLRHVRQIEKSTDQDNNHE